MATFTIKIDTRNKAAKKFLEFIKSLSFVTIEEQVEESPYNPEFVKKIKRAQKQKGIVVDTNDIWGSLGLK